nr:hypothetical protein CFP56_10605 [Quercus suber]
MSLQENLVEEAVAKLQSLKLLLPHENHSTPKRSTKSEQGKDVFHVFDKIQPWDRFSVEIQIAEIRLQRLVHYLPQYW